MRGDLLDRSILLTLPRLEDEAVRKEADLEREFEVEHLKILGALLDAAVVALERFDKIDLDKKVRMADAASWAVAGEEALALPRGRVHEGASGEPGRVQCPHPRGEQGRGRGLRTHDDRTEWTGTATARLNELDRQASDETKRSKQWPQSGRKLAGDLRRLAPAFRRVGLQLE